MSANVVLLEIEKKVATITLNRPDKHNAFDDEVIARLTDILEELKTREDLIAVVLRGNGKSFSAGADLNWMRRAAGYTQEQNREDALKLSRMLHRLYTLPKITIACVQGAAMGGGMGLAACCDIVIAQNDAVFALSEVRLGLIPATIGPYVIRAMGERQARRYFQTGQRLTAAGAHDIGFVHELVADADEMREMLKALIESLHQNGPHAMSEAKKLCLDLAGRPVSEEVITDMADRIAAIRSGPEAQERITAFLEQRKAG